MHGSRRRRRRRRSKLAVVGFNLVFFLVLLELVGLGDYLLKTGRLYYLDRPTAEPLAAGRDSVNSLPAYRLHPYFGYVLRPAVVPSGARTRPQNNHGFDEPHDVPYVPRDEDEIVVGIFGGSVAAKLHAFESRRQVLAGRVAAALGRRDGVTLLNFAQGGFKQPQQLLIHDYFSALGQRLDVVINVDGFNEIALAALNVRRGIAVEMPSADHVVALREIVGGVVEGEGLDRMLSVRVARQKYARMSDRAWSGEAWELRFAAGFLIDRKLAKIYRGRYRNALEAHAERPDPGGESWLYLSPGPGEPEPDLSAAADLWARSSALMHARQFAAGGLYLHFLQPNQYHATRRVLSDAERRVALHEESPYAEPARRGYPLLRQQATRLRAAGVRFHDLTAIFDDVEAPVYVDSCCHYTDAGQEVFADAVADAVAAALGESLRGG